ncbi:thiamine transporter ThiT [Bradyrhizobium sp. LB8.2]|uniref:ArnT family glycosyltransferase n=1 Tax=unclassified Bradyrhizobium TaxID=2631580 RepID=UPI003398A682
MQAHDRASHPAGDIVGEANNRLACWMLLACLLFAIGQLVFNALTLDTWMDEGKYLMKGYWYLTGQIAPYSALDPTWYMPLPFYTVGSMERLFGTGYLPGRALMILFAIGCLVLVYLAGARIGRSRLAGVGPAILVVGYPVTLTYFATATPYAMVSCLSLAMIHILLAANARRIAYAIAGGILWALLFARPDMLPFAMIPTGWALLIEPRRKLQCFTIGFLTFLAASMATLWIFGRGLVDVVLDTPGLAQIAMALGVPAAPTSNILPLTVSPLDPVVRLSEIPVYFNSYFFRPYFVVSVITLAMIGLRIVSASRSSEGRRLKPIDLILAYFWITAILHYMLSLSYCVDCIIPYTNYFLPVGALGAAALIGEISRLGRSRQLVYVALGGLCITGAVMHVFPSFPSLLRPQTEKVRTAATDISRQLRQSLPPTGRVFVLSDRVEVAQAVWLAGGVIEPRSLYLPTVLREPKPGLTNEQRDRVNSAIWEAGFWSEASMRLALVQDYQTLLIERRKDYGDTLVGTVRDGIPFGDVVAKHFALTASFAVGERTFEVYRRHE